MMKTEWKTKQDLNTIDTDLQFGLSIIPVKKNKIPFKPWAEFQKKTAPFTEWHSHFCKQGTLGIITGEVSGNLEIIDIDLKNDPLGTIMDEYIKLIPPDLYNRLIIQTTPNKGFHLIYCCNSTTIEKNQKLALHTNKEVIIETRGEGGYFCTSKINNKVLQGVFDLEHLDVNIPLITKDERDLLLETARSLTRYFPSITESTSKNDNQFLYNKSAINDFNSKYNIIDLFTKNGWTVSNEDDLKYYLLRKGSSAPHSGYYFKESKVFFCFSSSTEFKPEKPYNHFQVLQVLEGSNDYNKSIRLLSEYGYSTTDKKEKVSTDDIADYLNNIGIRFDAFIQDLTFNGKVIEEKDYNTAYINLKKHFDREIPRTRFEETIKSHYITTINPIEDFISTNIHRNPTGTFERWLDCIVLQNKSVDKSILLHFLKKWYVGMIAQALGAEYPNEFFLTLLSVEQGVGKTTFLRNYTLPKELHSYRVEHALSFDDDFKVIMGQALLVIDDEMDGRTYEADKTFKTVLSTKELTTRRKYDRRISTIKRRCSFAGSGNNLNVVREQQNRRIIPIEIEKMHFDKLAQIDYTDLFMEAYNLYENGFKYSYQREDINLLKSIYNDYVQKSDIDLILDEYILKPESMDVYYISSLDLVTCLATHFPHFSKRINVVAIGKLMNDRGLKTVRKGANKKTGYEISKDSRIVQLIIEDNNTICLG